MILSMGRMVCDVLVSPVDALAEAVANGETIKTEIIGDEATGRVLVITAESESAEVAAQPEGEVLAKKPMGKGRGKKGVATKDSNYK